MTEIYCPACLSEDSTYLGNLGVDHFRCRRCGVDFHLATEEPSGRRLDPPRPTVSE